MKAANKCGYPLFFNPAANVLIFVNLEARINRIVDKKVQFSSLHVEKWMIFCNFAHTITHNIIKHG